MPDEVLQSLKVLAQVLEIVGASAMVLGFVIATALCFRRSLQQGAIPAVNRYRRSLGRVILIGLEILVAATIIKTITFESTVEGMSLLAIMVAIRTTLGWTMVLEMNGRWPWQKPRPNAAKMKSAWSSSMNASMTPTNELHVRLQMWKWMMRANTGMNSFCGRCAKERYRQDASFPMPARRNTSLRRRQSIAPYQALSAIPWPIFLPRSMRLV